MRISRSYLCSVFIDRICGLETQPALLVITSTSLHIVDGMHIKKVTSGLEEERMLQWVGPAKPAPGVRGAEGFTRRASIELTSPPGATVASSPASTLRKFISSFGNSCASGEEDAQWLTQVCEEMLRGDMGHHQIPLDQAWNPIERFVNFVLLRGFIFVYFLGFYDIPAAISPETYGT